MKSLSAATVFAALSGFLVVIVATRTLDEEAGKHFQAYWGLFFACTGILDGITQETTRTVSIQKEGAPMYPRGGRRNPSHTLSPWHFALLIGLSAAALSLVSEPLWVSHILGDHRMAGSGLLALGLCLYAFQAVLSGVLSGWEQWPQYARLIALDSGVRFALSALAAFFGWNILPFLIITVIGTLSWMVILVADPEVRAHLRTPRPVSLGGFAHRAGAAMVATGASAVIITGAAPLIQVTMEEPTTDTGVALTGIMLAISLTRAPILVPLQRFQSALIVYFVRHRARMRQSVAAPASASLAVGIAGAGLAWLIGPWILGIGWNHDPAYAVPGPLLAALTFASSCTGVLVITGSATIAAERHRLYVAGWVAASATVCTILWYGSDPLRTIPLALTAGPILGALVHLSALRARAAGRDGAGRLRPTHTERAGIHRH